MQWRSPEEYSYKSESEAIDVYSLGHILNFVWTGNVPFGDLSLKEAIQQVKNGERAVPVATESMLLNMSAPERAIRQAMDMCFEFDPKKRASAREVTNLLRRALDEME